MFWIYLAATIFGGAFVIPMLLGGFDSEFGGDLEVDGDVATIDAGDMGEVVDIGTDVDLDTDADLGADSGGDALGEILGSLLSFRTVVFFSAFFGAAGLVFGALGYSATITLVTALFIGLVAGGVNSVFFGLLKSSQANSQISDRSLEGRRAKVVLPIGVDRRGRIRIDLSGQPQYMVARSYNEKSEKDFDVGTSVVVVQVENGTALVSSLAELDLGIAEE